MSLGSLRNELSHCCAPADQVIWFRGERIHWDLHELAKACVIPAQIADNVEKLVKQLVNEKPRSEARRQHWVIMSNGDFGGIYERLTEALVKDVD